MIKIVHFIHGFNMGGAETLVKDYALLFNKKKIDLTILCFENHNSPWDKILKENDIRIIYINELIKYNGNKRIIFRLINGIQRFLLVRKYIRSIKPDVIHQHLPISKYLVFANPVPKTKFVYTQHFDVSRLIENHRIDIWSTKKLIKKYKSKIIAINPKMQEDIRNLYTNVDCEIYNNGIDLSKFAQLSSPKEKRRELGIHENSFLIGHVGRFNVAKNHEFLIDIFSEICKIQKKAHLLLVGDGELKEQIEEKIKRYNVEQQVTILSHRTDIPELMNAMDIFVFPSITEGLPLSCIEAQVAGTVCLVSDAITKMTKVSNLIRYKSLTDGAKAWANEIVQLSKTNVEYYTIEEWDIKNIVLKLEKMYEELVETN